MFAYERVILAPKKATAVETEQTPRPIGQDALTDGMNLAFHQQTRRRAWSTKRASEL